MSPLETLKSFRLLVPVNSILSLQLHLDYWFTHLFTHSFSPWTDLFMKFIKPVICAFNIQKFPALSWLGQIAKLQFSIPSYFDFEFRNRSS